MVSRSLRDFISVRSSQTRNYYIFKLRTA